jgi:DNA-binding CsgD family transcriptional regulator
MVGLLLLNAQLHPVHYNAEAANILGFPKKARHVPSLDSIFPTSVLRLEDVSKPGSSSGIEFVSGRRRYICRLFMLGPQATAGGLQPRVVVVLERVMNKSVDMLRSDFSQVSERYQLTNRERETVEFLLKGLTSKEIAQEMHISPNTVKSFLKLAMAKVGATTRAGLIARIFERAS